MSDMFIYATNYSWELLTFFSMNISYWFGFYLVECFIVYCLPYSKYLGAL